MDPPSLDNPSPRKASGPLNPVSPDRINQQRLPISASVQDLSDSKHHRNSSDVQSKVAFLNSLNTRSSIATAPVHHANPTSAALQRAIIGREEAESNLRNLRAVMEEARTRERKISERVESLMEELQTTNERRAHERQIYEKEMKRARKDAFRAGSALVKTQEDLKEARAELRNLKSSLQKEKFEKEKAKQEAFERAYTLAGLTEEMQTLKEKLKAAEAAQEAQVTIQEPDNEPIEEAGPSEANPTDSDDVQPQPQEEESIGSTEQQEVTDGQSVDSESLSEGPRRRNRFERPILTDAMLSGADMNPRIIGPRRETFFRSTWEDEDLHIEDRMEDLQAELLWEKKHRLEAEDLIHFMNMQCQFHTCPCRLAEKEGKRFIHDWDFENKMRALSIEAKRDGQNEEQADDNNDGTNYLADESCEPVEHALQQQELAPEALETEQANRSYTPEGPPNCTHQEEILATEDIVTTPIQGTFVQEQGRLEPEAELAPESESSPDLFDISRPVPQTASTTAEDTISLSHLTPIRPSTISLSQSVIHHEQAPSPEQSADSVEASTLLVTPARPTQRMIHAETTTITVPLRDHDEALTPMPGTPGTPAFLPGTPISREEALAQIRARRDRARSVSMKHKEARSAPASVSRAKGVRDISAPGGF